MSMQHQSRSEELLRQVPKQILNRQRSIEIFERLEREEQKHYRKMKIVKWGKRLSLPLAGLLIFFILTSMFGNEHKNDLAQSYEEYILAQQIHGTNNETGSPPSAENQMIQVKTHQAEDIPFENGHGRATVVYERKGMFDLMILAKGLDPNEKYEITLVKDGKGGVIFGPEANMNIRFGKMVDETIFQPNDQGELFVSMLNPDRIAQGADELRIRITSEEGKEIMTTYPFVLKEE